MIKEAIIIDGKQISEIILADLKAKIEIDKKQEFMPAKLAIILVGDDPASTIYVQNKIRAALRVGILTELKQFDSTLSAKALSTEISRLNNDPEISGIIILLPLPDHIDKPKVIMAVRPDKDVDGFHPINIGLLYSPFEHGFVPCTARGCLDLIKSCVDDLAGKNVVVIGRSNIIGRPLAALLLKEDCTVIICHSKTRDLASVTYGADIVVSAIGKPKFLTKEHFNSNAVVIDVGINRLILENKCTMIRSNSFLVFFCPHISPC